MNKHILLVMKWLNDKDSVTMQELKVNSDCASAASAYGTADLAADLAAEYALAAASTDVPDVPDTAAKYWVTRYFKSTGEPEQDYIDANEGL